MNVVSDSLAARTSCREARAKNERVGLVPTMGALHRGHLALIDCARRQCGFVVVSIFVNPDQFGKGEDFDAYPRCSEEDFELCRRHAVDMIFYPETGAFAGSGRTISVHESALSRELCGRFRPGHFDGVLTVVTRLFNVIEPDFAFFGQKDLQQCILIQRLVRDLHFNIQIRVLPTVREDDGLALSSRNAYLSDQERSQALVLHRGLEAVGECLRRGERSGMALRLAMVEKLREEPAVEIEYAEIVHLETLQSVVDVSGPLAAAVCVRLGKARLIDNRVFDERGEAFISSGE